MPVISEQDQERISAAIAAAEKTTSGEIVCVVTAASASYAYVPPLFGGAVALLVPWPLIFLTWMPVQHIYLLQLLAFLLVGMVTALPAIRLALVPGSVKRDRAHRRAVEQFVAQNLHTTAGRTGVLIFVSVAERYAEIIADDHIYQRVPKDTWQRIVDGLTERIGVGKPADGFTEAIAAAGRLLAEHYPPGTIDSNELPNHLIVID